MKPQTVIIKPRRRPWVYVLAGALLVIGILAAIYQARVRFDEALSAERAVLAREKAKLRGATTDLRAENASLKTQLQISERETLVERSAREDVEQYMKERQAEVLQLTEEIEFYRRILAEPGQSGIKVQTVNVQAGEKAGAYTFELVLTRSMDSEKVLKGFVSVFVSGSDGEKMRTVSLGEMKDSTRSPLEFEFKYFQRLTGRLVLPPDFDPRRISVIVRAANGKQERVQKTIDWEAATG